MHQSPSKLFFSAISGSKQKRVGAFSNDELSSPSQRSRGSDRSYALLSMRRDRRAHSLGKKSPRQRHSPANSIPYLSTPDTSHVSDYLLAHPGDHLVGVVLSLVLLPIMGSVLLFFSDQLFDGRLWRCDSPASVADVGPRRRRHWSADVRPVREPHVRDRDPNRGERGTNRIRISVMTRPRRPLTLGLRWDGGDCNNRRQSLISTGPPVPTASPQCVLPSAASGAA